MTLKRHESSNLPALVFFVGQRLLFGALVLLAIAFLSYLGLDMAEGSPSVARSPMQRSTR